MKASRAQARMMAALEEVSASLADLVEQVARLQKQVDELLARVPEKPAAKVSTARSKSKGP